MIQGLVFDKDGTLFDFNATWGAWACVMMMAEAQGDAQVLQRLAGALGYDLDQRRFRPGSVVIASTADVVADRIVAVLPQLDKPALMKRMKDRAKTVRQIEVTPLAGFFDRLARLSLTIGLATNDDEATARDHLRTANILHHFDYVAGCDSGYGSKPAPGQLAAFCDQAGLAPDTCVMVGDSLHDLAAGRAAGMITIGVLTGPAPKEELAPMADAILTDIRQLPAWLCAPH